MHIKMHACHCQVQPQKFYIVSTFFILLLDILVNYELMYVDFTLNKINKT